jgi:hypothetical protein
MVTLAIVRSSLHILPNHTSVLHANIPNPSIRQKTMDWTRHLLLQGPNYQLLKIFSPVTQHWTGYNQRSLTQKHEKRPTWDSPKLVRRQKPTGRLLDMVEQQKPRYVPHLEAIMYKQKLKTLLDHKRFFAKVQYSQGHERRKTSKGWPGDDGAKWD